MLRELTSGMVGRTLCAIGMHLWSSSPRIGVDEYGTVIDHACDRCEQDRFDRAGRYAGRLDRWRQSVGISPGG